jgi:guanylate kinase
MRRGIPFVLAAPSGTGKSTVCREVLRRGEGIVLSVSHTTRPPRPGERDGVEYRFVSDAAFRRMIEAGEFLEHAEYSRHRYGTAWAAIREPLAHGLDVLLEIETEGARQVRARCPDAHLIFLLPPSQAELERRLRARGTDAADEIVRRLAIARREFQAAPLFDTFVVNERLEQAAADVLTIVSAVRAGQPDRLDARFRQPAVRARLDPELAAWLSDSGGGSARPIP